MASGRVQPTRGDRSRNVRDQLLRAAARHVEDEDAAGVLAVGDPARRLDNLWAPPRSKFRRRSASRVVDELINVMKDTLHQSACHVRIL